MQRPGPEGSEEGLPEIEIRPATSADLPALTALDPHYTSEYVWQLEVDRTAPLDGAAPAGQIDVRLRQTRLPRPVRVEYPRPASRQAQEWARRSELLAALLSGEPVGYASLALDRAAGAAWLVDLVVHRPLRRQGIGTGLILASAEWAVSRECRQVIVEMQPRNHPAYQMAQKLGFEFCGYNDLYYGNHGIGLFFRKSV